MSDAVRPLVQCVRFFRVVSPVPALMRRTLFVVAAVAGVSSLVLPERAPSALGALLLLQLFSAASGFALPCRRGYYDLLLIGGATRMQIAGVHWLMSIAPGLAAWVVIAILEAAATRGHGADALASGSLAALWLVSTIPWAVTVRLPRFSGAVGWLVLFALTLIVWPDMPTHGRVQSPHDVWPAGDTMAAILYPAGLIGRDISSRLEIVVGAIGLGLASLLASLLWIERTDFPLESAQ